MTTQILYTRHFRDGDIRFVARGFDLGKLAVFEVQPDGTEKPTMMFFPSCVRFMPYSEPIGEVRETPVGLPALDPGGLQDVWLPETLLVIPCSGSKRSGGRSMDSTGASILDALPADLAAELRARRAENARSAVLDESALLPAVDRNTGHLYRAAGTALGTLIESAAGVLIISGGYGVVTAAEPIGWYERVFQPAKWPDRLIGRCIASYAAAVNAKSVVGLFSATTGYAKAFRSAPWPDTVQNVFQMSPQARARDGAQIKAPRALGEAWKEIRLNKQLPSWWTSSDGLYMDATWLRCNEGTDIRRIVGRLSYPVHTEDPRRFPVLRVTADSPGLYSWWADSTAIELFEQVVGRVHADSCIYVGQAGATKQPSGKTSRATLKSRILGNHIRGNVGSSTFRRTISSILFEPLNLRLEKRNRLARDSNNRVSAWIKDHLRVAMVPYPDRDSLLNVEKDVMAKLDPPFNLDGVPTNDLRLRLKNLRTRLVKWEG